MPEKSTCSSLNFNVAALIAASGATDRARTAPHERKERSCFIVLFTNAPDTESRRARMRPLQDQRRVAPGFPPDRIPWRPAKTTRLAAGHPLTAQVYAAPAVTLLICGYSLHSAKVLSSPLKPRDRRPAEVTILAISRRSGRRRNLKVIRCTSAGPSLWASYWLAWARPARPSSRRARYACSWPRSTPPAWANCRRTSSRRSTTGCGSTASRRARRSPRANRSSFTPRRRSARRLTRASTAN